MRIHIATDHAGLEFSRTLVDHLTNGGHEVIDHGPAEYETTGDIVGKGVDVEAPAE